MTKFRTVTASLLISTCLTGNIAAQESSAIDAEIAAINSQIKDVDVIISSHERGMIREEI
jgi:hypothetical protein